MGISLKEKFELCQAYGETLETIGKANRAIIWKDILKEARF